MLLFMKLNGHPENTTTDAKWILLPSHSFEQLVTFSFSSDFYWCDVYCHFPENFQRMVGGRVGPHFILLEKEEIEIESNYPLLKSSFSPT